MAAKRGKANSEEDATFEQVVERLQVVVEQLEGGELSLEESLEKFEEGVRLSRLGQRRLDDAERRVEILLSKNSGIETEPFEGEAQ
ncbi:MAG: exodeoxyribonuclease VII small subunit [Polyangiales bacterium]